MGASTESGHSGPLMLGVSGMRGISGLSLTRDVGARYAFAFGEWLRTRYGTARPRVVLGADGRRGFEMVRGAARDGLASSGCEVIDVGVAATPSIGVALDVLGAHGAMIVTASHNPQEWNGLKCLIRDVGAPAGAVSACAPPAVLAAEIVERYHALGVRSIVGGAGAAKVGDPGMDVHAQHVRRIRDVLPPREAKGMSALLDSCGASGAAAGGLLLDSARGLAKVHVNASGDGVFPHVPEPTEENLREIASMARQRGCDVAFAQDPDADRLAIIDENGRYIGEEYTLVLCALAALKLGAPGNPVAVTNLSTSRMIDDLMNGAGGHVVRTAVGEANVVSAMKHEAGAGSAVVMGGEGNGGVIWPSVTYVRDSISGMALVLDLLARERRTLSEIVDREFTPYVIIKRKIPIARKEDALPHVERIAGHFTGARVDLQDGVRVDFDERRSWFHVRASNTEPIMRIIAEGRGGDEVDALIDQVMQVVGSG